MAVIKNKTSESSREYWSHVEEVARQVGRWPSWMNKATKTSKNEGEPSGKPQARAAKAAASSVSNNT